MTQPPYVYDVQAVLLLLEQISFTNMPEKGQQWLRQQQAKALANEGFQVWNLTFTAMPRSTGKQTVTLTGDQQASLAALVPGFSVQHWPLDRVARVWWLLQWPSANEALYVRTITTLFQAASMEELTALYSVLPLLAWPSAWVAQTAEGIRSNIGDVLEAIMLHNPYPAAHLPEAAWNQLILKAFFTTKPVSEIIGLQQRNNATLQQMLKDYAAERTAAGRAVDAALWTLAEQEL